MSPVLAWCVGSAFVLILVTIAVSLIIAIVCDRKDRE